MAIHAVSQARRPGSVIEHVSKVSVAISAANFSPGHEKCPVLVLAYGGGFERGVETWPAGAGIKFGRSIKQRLVTEHSVVNPGFMIVPVRAGKRPFCAVFASDMILFWGQLLAPVGIGFYDFWIGCLTHIISPLR